jgi:hypothetical protein
LTADPPSDWSESDGSVWLAERTGDAVVVAFLASTDTGVDEDYPRKPEVTEWRGQHSGT